MCGSCVAKVTPVLNELVGTKNWKIDIGNPAKILTVNSDVISEQQVAKAVETAGYKATAISK